MLTKKQIVEWLEGHNACETEVRRFRRNRLTPGKYYQRLIREENYSALTWLMFELSIRPRGGRRSNNYAGCGLFCPLCWTVEPKLPTWGEVESAIRKGMKRRNFLT